MTDKNAKGEPFLEFGQQPETTFWDIVDDLRAQDDPRAVLVYRDRKGQTKIAALVGTIDEALWALKEGQRSLVLLNIDKGGK